MCKIHISNGNTKVGDIPNISFPPGSTCRKGAPCLKDGCYALKFYRMYSTCRTAWDENLEYYMTDPAGFERDLKERVKMARYFRYFVSGDIPAPEFVDLMMNVAWENPHCEFLAFTKQYEFVNDYVREYSQYSGIPVEEVVPKNMHILFSRWEGLVPDNPYHFPETAVYNKGDEIPEEWLLCGGNCTNCACRGVGCWQTKPGDVLAFQKH